MSSPPHALTGTLYAEYEAVIAAVIYGIEAAAYLSLAVLAALGTLKVLLGALHWMVWR